MKLNIKALCKQVKKDGKSNLIWTLSNGIHYITNRHWAVKFDELPRELKITLFSIFAEFPTEENCLNMTWDSTVLRPKAPDIEKVFKDSEGFEENGVITNIILDYADYRCRVIKFNETIIRVSEEYMNMMDYNKEHVRCSGKLQPVIFCDGQLLILPFRSENTTEDREVNELLLVG